MPQPQLQILIAVDCRNATVTDTTNSAGTLVSDDTDADASSSLYVTKITSSGGTETVQT